MPDDDNYERLIWMAGGNTPVTVCASIRNNGLGSIVFERYLDSGDSEIVGSSGGVSVDQYCVTIEDDLPNPPNGMLSLTVRVAAGNIAGDDMPVFLMVTQNGEPLPLTDTYGDPIEIGELGHQLQPRVARNQVGQWEFDICFS